jgi:hypothetical protein
MSDIVERLRAPAYWFSGSSEGHEGENSAPLDAASTIERLRVELTRINMENDRLTRTNRAKREHRNKLLHEITRLRAALREDRAAREFARWAIRNTAWQGGSLDGGDVQEMAEKLGIIERRTATVENKDQWQFIDYVAPGDWFYVLADWIKPDLARAALGGET